VKGNPGPPLVADEVRLPLPAEAEAEADAAAEAGDPDAVGVAAGLPPDPTAAVAVQPALLMVLWISVTAPSRASSRPRKVAPSYAEIEVSASTVPAK
jgi:hypothetical protein